LLERNVRFSQFIAVTWLALVCAFGPAHAEKRVALVVGNDRYTNLPEHEQLQKAVKDAGAVSGALQQLGFEVMSGENLARQALVDKLDAFTQRLSQGDTAFFFFAGHGVALSGANYILPSDIPEIEANQEVRLARAALAEHDIVSDLQGRGVRVAVVVLDACRTNPFGRPGSRSVGGERGLAPPPQAKGVFSLYAAGAGQAARDRLSDDDRNPNSVFSRVLVPVLTRPGIDLQTLAIDVREDVARVAQTAGYVQEPAYYDGTIGGRVYLAGLPPPSGLPGTAGGTPTPPPPAGPAADDTTWSYLKDTRDAELLRRFIREYPASPHRHDAEERLKALEQTNVVITVPVRPPNETPVGNPCSGVTTVSLTSSRKAAPLSLVDECSLKPKNSFRECEKCPEMVVIPAGSFTMGAPDSEKYRARNEGPQHIVTISKPFAVGKLHVTVDQFTTFVRETRYEVGARCNTPDDREYKAKATWRNIGYSQAGSHPVGCLSWNDAKAYVDWLAKKTGRPYRLLSEAEFEYAARGQTSPGAYPRFWFGDDEKDLCQYANSVDQKARADADNGEYWPFVPCSDGYAYTSPAGHYKPNAFGLYDMAGNAWQWTEDCYHNSYVGAPTDGSAWTASPCEAHVVRGGAWSENPNDLRAAWRISGQGWRINQGSGGCDCDAYDRRNGFRVARTLTPS
jgi:formylglycine-generating enzyme required for sulfatase activity